MPGSSSIRRKHSVRWFIGLLLLLCVAWFAFQLFGQNPPIVVSKETTYITQPLGSDGLPDYLEFIRHKKRQGISQKRNAVVLLAQIAGTQELTRQAKQTYLLELGIQASETLGRMFAPLGDELQQFVQKAGGRPWKSENSPQLVNWLKDNQVALDIAVLASNRKQFYSPVIADGRRPPLMSILLPMESDTRDLANALCIRAMWHLSGNRNDAAIIDALAASRLARLMAKDAFLICRSIGLQCDELAMKAMQSVLASPQIQAEEAKLLSSALQEFSNWSPELISLNPFARLMILDAVLDVHRYGADSLTSSDEDKDTWSWLDFIPVDYNITLRDVNDWYDRIDEVLVMKNRAKRKEAWDAVSDDLDQVLLRAMKNKKDRTHQLDLRKRSQLISDILVSLLFPDIWDVLNSQDRANAQLNLTRIAAALAVYRAEHGNYPEKLATLVPEILAELPLDLYSGQPFLYSRKDDGGYLLYSVFENGIDDGGTDMGGEIVDGEWVEQQSEDFDHDASDLVIRVPVPAFELPEMPRDEFGSR